MRFEKSLDSYKEPVFNSVVIVSYNVTICLCDWRAQGHKSMRTAWLTGIVGRTF
jgi:hypothetical protein